MQAQLKLKYNKTKFFFIALSVFFSLFPFLDKLLRNTTCNRVPRLIIVREKQSWKKDR